MSSMLKKQSDLAQLADNLEKQTDAYTNAEYRYALAQNACFSIASKAFESIANAA